MKVTLIASLLLLSVTTFAKNVTIEVKNGVGVDGKPCKAEITYNDEDNTLVDVKLDGATRDFEIMAETSKGYGPKKSISPRGADEILSMFQESPKLYDKFTSSGIDYKGVETYTLSTKDLLKDAPPAKDGEDLKFISGMFILDLHYDNEGNLTQVDAENSFKTLKFIKLASRKFTCAAPEVEAE